MTEKKRDEWDRIHYPELTNEENDEIRTARRSGFASFFPMAPSAEAQSRNTPRRPRTQRQEERRCSMTEKKPSPRPWKLGVIHDHSWQVYDARNRPIAHINAWEPEVEGAHIVHVVNTYDEVVAALEALLHASKFGAMGDVHSAWVQAAKALAAAKVKP